MLSVVSALAACVVWLFVLLNDNGAEYYGLQAIMVSHFAGGSILVEAYFVLRYLFQRNKISRGQKGGGNEKVFSRYDLTLLLCLVLVGVLLWQSTTAGSGYSRWRTA